MKTVMSLLLAGVLVGLVAACNNSNQPSPSGLQTTEVAQWVGKNVRIELRRDALGLALLSAVPVTGATSSPPTAIVGKLLKLHSISLLVDSGQRQIWIPREVILYIELEP
jgi:hypothetical protein